MSLFTDKGCSNRIARLSGSVWNPIMVPADRVYYRFTSEKKSSYKKDWGYRFYVSSVSGLQWQNERQVMSDKSLEWASWLLRFLLSDLGESSTGEASSLTSHPLVRSPSVISADITGGMVHNAVVADAIVRYIRTPSLPFKQRAVSLLAHLLKAPQLFPLDKLPDMAVIHSVCNIALKRCVAERSSSKQLFLPEGLLLFAELSVTAAAAQHVFDTRLELRMRKVAEDGIGSPAPQLTRPKLAKSWSGVEPRSQPARFGVGSGFASAVIVSDAAGPLVPPFEVSLPAPYLQGLPLPLPTSTLPPPNKLNHEDLSALLSDVADLAHCLSKGSRLPDRLVCRAWLDSLAHSDFSASPHPLFSGDMPTDGLLRYTGKLHIPGASRLLVQLDNRSNVPIGSQLIVKDGSGRLVSSIGGPVTSYVLLCVFCNAYSALKPSLCLCAAWGYPATDMRCVNGSLPSGTSAKCWTVPLRTNSPPDWICVAVFHQHRFGDLV